jgi:hypothetical protein
MAWIVSIALSCPNESSESINDAFVCGIGDGEGMLINHRPIALEVGFPSPGFPSQEGLYEDIGGGFLAGDIRAGKLPAEPSLYELLGRLAFRATFWVAGFSRLPRWSQVPGVSSVLISQPLTLEASTL